MKILVAIWRMLVLAGVVTSAVAAILILQSLNRVDRGSQGPSEPLTAKESALPTSLRVAPAGIAWITLDKANWRYWGLAIRINCPKTNILGVTLQLKDPVPAAPRELSQWDEKFRGATADEWRYVDLPNGYCIQGQRLELLFAPQNLAAINVYLSGRRTPSGAVAFGPGSSDEAISHLIDSVARVFIKTSEGELVFYADEIAKTRM